MGEQNELYLVRCGAVSSVIIAMLLVCTNLILVSLSLSPVSYTHLTLPTKTLV